MENLTGTRGPAAGVRSSCPTGWSSCSARRRCAARTWTRCRRAVARARGDPPRLQRRARAAQRAPGLDPRRPRLAGLAARLGRGARPPRRRADGRSRGDRRPASPALCTACTGPRARGQGGAALQAALGGRQRRGAGRGARRARWTPTSSAGSPATARTATTLGFRREGRELRAYGSRGQQRLGLLALLLAEREELADAHGAAPLLLLDDVMSELDATRRGGWWTFCAATARP